MVRHSEHGSCLFVPTRSVRRTSGFVLVVIPDK
jgi:hypothetical protein